HSPKHSNSRLPRFASAHSRPDVLRHLALQVIPHLFFQFALHLLAAHQRPEPHSNDVPPAAHLHFMFPALHGSPAQRHSRAAPIAPVLFRVARARPSSGCRTSPPAPSRSRATCRVPTLVAPGDAA